MNFGYEDYEEEETESSKLDFFNKYLRYFEKMNNTSIIIGFIFILIIIFLFNFFSPSSRYGRIEKKMVKAAQKYAKDNYLNVDHEVYLDVKTIDFNLNSKCSQVSGVFYDGNDFTPYLFCDKYESKVVNNQTKEIKLNGKDVVILAKGLYFNDPGVVTNSKTNIIGEVGNEEGVYNLYYFNINNDDVVTRKVVILNNDNQDNIPSISLNGNDVVHVFKGESYNEEGVVAMDKTDGDISDKVVVSGSVNTSEYGQYLLVYSITNKNGFTNSVTRMVNVVDKDMTIKADYLVSPLTVVNTNVNISLKITGNDFDYVLLPDNTKSTNTYINYKVEKNGSYVFSIYDKAGRVIKKEVKITNIDKDLPLATCDAVIYSNYANIIVTPLSLKNISSYEYQIDGVSQKSISSTYHYNYPSINSASVTINNISGNKNVIDCEVTDYNNWRTDYSKSIVFIKSDTSNDVLKKYTLSDYMMAVVYKELIDMDFSIYSKEQLINLFKTMFILKKAEVLKNGGYNASLKQIVFSVDEGNYCDVYTGCKLVNKNNKNFYLSNDIDYEINSVVNSKNKLSDEIINIMKNAYNETKRDIITSTSFKQALTNYNEEFSLSDTMKETIIDEIKNNNTYQIIISNNFRNYQIYNITYYSNKLVEPKIQYYWPIGSSYSTNGIYGGTPDSVSILHNYGASVTDNKIYDYLAIKGDCNKTNVVAVWSGIVTQIDSDKEYGNYVIIDHGEGIKFVYGSLSKSSINLSVGTTVKRGELIGKVGNASNNCALYIKTVFNDEVVNPGDYISASEPRPASGENIIYVPGSTVKESVCLSLVASGLSSSSVAGIMANMESESNFNLQSLGDGGTSYGLCQWHSGRWTNLKNYCGNRINTVDCQLEYLLYELKKSYSNVYSYVIGNYSAYDVGYNFCYSFEIPAARNTSCQTRGDKAQNKYLSYVLNGCQ